MYPIVPHFNGSHGTESNVSSVVMLHSKGWKKVRGRGGMRGREGWGKEGEGTENEENIYVDNLYVLCVIKYVLFFK